jgi:hypothetical protein
MYGKFLRRARSLERAWDHHRRANEKGDARRAFRAAALIETLDNWLVQNAPFAVTTYSDF